MLQTILFDIDTQFDFMNPDGKLYAKGAQELLPNLSNLFALAERHRYTTISTMCAHTPDDPEFKQFGPHCINGTPGQLRIMPDRPRLPLRTISADARGGVVFETGIHYIVEKRKLDLLTNTWMANMLKKGKLSGFQAIVFGVATEYCVNDAVKGLLGAKIKTYVITDAVKAIDEAAGARTIEDWRSKGVNLLSTKELFENFRWLGHMPAQGQETTVGTPRPKYPGHAPRH
jgi:Amidases related to nicotinamidase